MTPKESMVLGWRRHLASTSLPSWIGCFALGASVSVASAASAQPSFSRLAESATEVEGSLLEVAAPFFQSCDDAGDARAVRACRAEVRAARREFERETFLVTMPAEGRVEIGNYEPMDGGFRVRLRGVLLRDGERALSTAPTAGGALGESPLVEGFATVPEAGAARWLMRNVPSRLVLRLIVRFGDDYRDGDLRGVILQVVAAQIYNEGTGEVPLDTTREPGPPPAPRVLEQRIRLWDANGEAQAVWTAPDGRTFLFHVENEPLVNPPNSSAPVLRVWRGAERRNVVQFVAPCCDANVSIAPRDVETLTVIITEQTPARGRPGRGQVLVIRFVAARGEFDVLARWRGTNTETPPAWVLDPSAPVPTVVDEVVGE